MTATAELPVEGVGKIGAAIDGWAWSDRRHVYAEPRRLGLNHWALSGDWTVRPQVATLNAPGGRTGHRFQGRDVD
ncbi:MAG TPA: hypothetical protein VGE11_20290 [Pseudonocardia sp.]